MWSESAERVPLFHSTGLNTVLSSPATLHPLSFTYVYAYLDARHHPQFSPKVYMCKEMAGKLRYLMQLLVRVDNESTVLQMVNKTMR